jgi:hypothetical protein
MVDAGVDQRQQLMACLPMSIVSPTKYVVRSPSI